MNLLEKLLTVSAFASMMAFAQAAGNPYDSGTLSPPAKRQTDVYSVPSFADLVNIADGTEYLTAPASATDVARVGTSAGWTRVAGVTLTPRAGSHASGQPGSGYLVSAAAIPEPADWMLLLCGLVVVAFIARRKTDLATG